MNSGKKKKNRLLQIVNKINIGIFSCCPINAVCFLSIQLLKPTNPDDEHYLRSKKKFTANIA